MTEVLDASMLILLFDGAAAGPRDAATGKPLEYCQERLRHLVETITKPRGSRLVIPTPAFSEFLVRVKPERVEAYLSQLRGLRGCEIIPFSTRAAIECAEMQRALISRREASSRNELATRAKIKFDLQIVAIAKVENAGTIYSDDEGLCRYAARFGIGTIGTAELPLSLDSAQASLPLTEPRPTDPRSSDEGAAPSPS